MPARTTIYRSRPRRIATAGLLLVLAVIAAALANQLVASGRSPASSGELGSSAAVLVPSGPDRALGEADGAVPDGTSVFDDDVPGVARLDSTLLSALRRAAGDAAADGVRLSVDSGWRSPRYQEHLLRQAIVTYGSASAAARWVATPSTSAHVRGHAIDIGPVGAAAWLSRNGARYGLCQIYGNEPWHFELRPEAIAHGCPPMYADPTHDPRMR